MYAELVEILGLSEALYGDLIALATVVTYVVLLVLIGKLLCFCLRRL